MLRIDCKSAKEILQKDVKNLVSKQIFARWQAILSAFDFDIEFIKGESNSLPDFLTREFLQGKCDKIIVFLSRIESLKLKFIYELQFVIQNL